MNKFYALLFSVFALGTVDVYAQCNHQCECHQPCGYSDAELNGSKTGTVTITKSGSNLKILNASGSSFSNKYYYIYVYQYAHVNRGKVQNENHNFNFGGYLSKGGTPKLVSKFTENGYLVYENDFYFLKVPFEQGRAVYFKQKSGGEGYSTLSWQKL